jgi:hypothetical protein
LIYNWQNFGNPFYNFATTHVMWMDRWAESQVEDPANWPTLTGYFQTHTLTDILDRWRVGLNRLNPELMTTLIPWRTLEPAWLGPAGLVGVSLLGGWLLIVQRDWLKQIYLHHQRVIHLFLFLFIPFYLFSAWYARVLIESRFLLPILGPFYLLLAAGVIGLSHRLKRWLLSRQDRKNTSFKSQAARWGYPILAAAILIWIGWQLVASSRLEAWSLSVDPFVSDREANGPPEAILTWLVRDYSVKKDEANVIFGPSKSLPLWKFPRTFTFERIPVDINNWAALQRYIYQAAPDYIIIDSDTARRRRQALGSHFTFYQEAGVEFGRVPPGWMLIYLHDQSPHTWSIFAPAAPPSRPVSVKLGEQIELVGYDLHPRFDADEHTLDVTLYWRALAAPEKDYTLFLHLTALDGFVKAQRDQPPFNGLWPTSRWTAGDLLADRYSISLEDGIQPGDYLLLAGLYEPQSVQRLSLVNAPPAPSPNAILLDKVKIEMK